MILIGIEFEDRELIRRVVANLKPRNNRERCNPRWVLVSRLFGVGSGVAKALCREFGFNPDVTFNE